MSGSLATIVHLDADAFFVSVELANRPELRGKRVAVGGRERGIITSASYEARAAGVYTPMPSQRARRVCPDLIMLPHTGNYGRVSRRMFDICEDVTPHVQRSSIDEGYMDLTPCGFRTQEQIESAMRALQARVWDELQIPISIGIATTRLVAQIASKLRKPRGFVVVPPGKEEAFMRPLELARIPGIGPKSREVLRKKGFVKIDDVLSRSDEDLERIFGDRWQRFAARCRGEDSGSVRAERDAAKSYSHQRTFGRDIGDFDTVENVAKGMIDDLMSRIRRDKRRVRTLSIGVRYPDFTHASAVRSLPKPADLETSFYPLVVPLLKRAWTKRRPLRLVSVKLSNPDGGPEQLEMFTERAEKRRRLARVLDQLNTGRQRGESPKVQRGHQLDNGR